MTECSYDALLLVSFGGPEGPEQVMPFLENVLRGRNVPRQRMLEVAEHYQQFGGVSPINEQNRQLMRALGHELQAHGIGLPIYWGNRNWHPLLVDTIRQMAGQGVERALALVTSAFGSYSGCRQYRENLVAACTEVGSIAPQIDKIRNYFNHPGFVDSVVDRARSAVNALAPGPAGVELVFTAHSIPVAMARVGPYERQLREACSLVAGRLGHPWQLVYQSRSGPPQQPWLEPDVLDYLQTVAERSGRPAIALIPLGFVSDHLEVIYDLDTAARQLCDRVGLQMVRAATVGTHPRFVTGLRQLIEERLSPDVPRLALGPSGPWPDQCPADCCLVQRST